MNTTKKASGTKRVVRKAKIEFDGWNWRVTGTGIYTGPVIVVTNPPPGLNCAKLKKLVEIAAMDMESVALELWQEHGIPFSDVLTVAEYFGVAKAANTKKALGLTLPKARAGRRRG